MALALDEPKETDQTFTIDGITYLVDKDLMAEARPIKIDFVDTGFQRGFSITSKVSRNSGTCGGTCSC